jgi:hypothetical protein
MQRHFKPDVIYRARISVAPMRWGRSTSRCRGSRAASIMRPLYANSNARLTRSDRHFLRSSPVAVNSSARCQLVVDSAVVAQPVG